MNEQMPPIADEPKKNNTIIIIAVVAVVVLCCCCIGLWAAWTYGDQILQSLNF
jgi:hypothetical protein